MHRHILAITVFLFSSFARAECVDASDSYIRVEGVVGREIFAGPPNYEDITKGDNIETFWFITSFAAICVSGLDESISKFQLIFRDKYPALFKTESVYVVKGITLEGISGHHHTPVLIEVSSFEENNVSSKQR